MLNVFFVILSPKMICRGTDLSYDAFTQKLSFEMLKNCVIEFGFGTGFLTQNMKSAICGLHYTENKGPA